MNGAEAAGTPGGTDVFSFPAIGTQFRISTARALPEGSRTDVLALCEDFDCVWSRFRADSLVTRIARAEHGGRFEIPARDLPLLDIYDRLGAVTHGAVNPLVGRDLELLGYDAEYSLRPDRAALASRVTDSWPRDVRRVHSSLVTERSVVVDVGAAGKGHLVDLIAGVLADAGVDAFLVDGSGDLRHRGPAPVRAGLEHPTMSGRVIGVVELQDESLCASATTRRTWGDRLHHVLDGRSGEPVTDVVATWVIAADTVTADGLATALFVADPASLEKFEFSWVRMLADGRIQWSNDFPGELYL